MTLICFQFNLSERGDNKLIFRHKNRVKQVNTHFLHFTIFLSRKTPLETIEIHQEVATCEEYLMKSACCSNRTSVFRFWCELKMQRSAHGQSIITER